MSGNRKKRIQPKKSFKTKLVFHQLQWLEWVAIGLSVWFIFFPKPYEFLFVILLIIPIFGLVLNGLTGRPSLASLVNVDRSEKEHEYDLADFIDIPALAILVRIAMDYEIEQFYKLLLPGTIGLVLFLLIIWATHKVILQSHRNKWLIYFEVIFNCILYSYSATYGINCVFDRSEPNKYAVEILDMEEKRSRKGRTSYYIEVNAWNHEYDTESIEISEEEYYRLKIGETIMVDIMEGALGIPWFYIET